MKYPIRQILNSDSSSLRKCVEEMRDGLAEVLVGIGCFYLVVLEILHRHAHETMR